MHTLNRTYKKPNKKHFMLQTENARTTTTTKKKFTMRIRQNPNSNYFNSMFAHYVVLDASSSIYICFQSLDESKSKQSRHARQRACSHTCECVLKWFFVSLPYIFRTIVLVIVQNILDININCLGSFHFIHTHYITMKWFT